MHTSLNNYTPFTVNDFFQGILNLIYPPFCISCRKLLDSNEKVVCCHCWNKIELTHKGNWKEELTYSNGIDYVFSGWYFDEILQIIIHHLKYSEKRILSEEFGKRLALMFADNFIKMEIDTVISIPLNSVRYRQRGFNQSELIGRSFAHHLNLKLGDGLLKRIRNTTSQTHLSATERINNMSGAFICKNLGITRNIVMIDDVITTGATMSAAAMTLKDAGASLVAVLSAGTPKIEFVL